MQHRLRMLIVGDFSGRGHRDGAATGDLAQRPLVAVDLDRFEAALARIGPRVEIAADGPLPGGAVIEFRSLDDFHPDRLFSRLETFSSLRESRARLLNPATFEAEAAALMQAGPAAGELDRLLGARPKGEAPLQQGVGTVQSVADRLVRSVVEGHVLQRDELAAAPYVAAVDALASERMRWLLHSPAFQSTESAWRAVRWLVEALDLDHCLRIELLDATKAELVEDAQRSKDDFNASKLHRRLLAPEYGDPDERSRSLLIGDFTFGPTPEDLGLLAALGESCASIGASFLAGASPSLIGCSDLASGTDPRQWSYDSQESEQRWKVLRSSRAAASIGLAMPRVLLRLPYGKDTDAIDAFSFSEMSGSDAHSEYLWGNPAFACALAIGRAFEAGEPDGALDETLEIGDLPAHVVERGGERQLQACAEYYLSSSMAEAIQDRGVIPLLSFRNRNAVRIAGLSSISSAIVR